MARATAARSASGASACSSASGSDTPAATRSAKCSAECCASSSTMSVARAGSTASAPRRARTSALKSGMAEPRDAVQRRDEGAPAPALLRERFSALDGQAVEAAAARVGPLHPSPFDEAAALEAVERRVERRDMELQGAARSLVDQPGDLVAVAVALLEQRHDQRFGAAFPQLAVGRHMQPAYVCSIHVSTARPSGMALALPRCRPPWYPQLPLPWPNANPASSRC